MRKVGYGRRWARHILAFRNWQGFSYESAKSKSYDLAFWRLGILNSGELVNIMKKRRKAVHGLGWSEAKRRLILLSSESMVLNMLE